MTLLVSVVAAPLVLLRSAESVAEGVRWFRRWESAADISKRLRDAKSETERQNLVQLYQTIDSREWRQIALFKTVATSASAAAAYFLAEQFLGNMTAWPAFGVGFAIGWVSLALSALVGSALAGLAIIIGYQPGPIRVNATLQTASHLRPPAALLLIPVALIGLAAVIVAAAQGGAGSAAINGTVFGTGLVGDLAYLLAWPMIQWRLGATRDGSPWLYVPRNFLMLVSFALPHPVMVGDILGTFALALIFRFAATAKYLRVGLQALPRNFRRLILCTSPRQEPELMPGLREGETRFILSEMLQSHLTLRSSFSKIFGFSPFVLNAQLAYSRLVLYFEMLILFLPSWTYRLSLKSTGWFWWPLAFLGGDLRRAKEPTLFHRKVRETLWARSSLVLSFLTVITFVIANFVLTGAIFERNPLLTVFGYLFVVDWSLRSWQLLAVASAVLSILMVYWIDETHTEYQYAIEKNDQPRRDRSERIFGWIERLQRFRLFLLIGFWLLVGGHTALYFNSLNCWVTLPANVERWATTIYADRVPLSTCSSGDRARIIRLQARFRRR